MPDTKRTKLRNNQEEWIKTAKDVANCAGVNLYDLISRTSAILEFSPVPVRPAVEVLLKIFELVSQVKDQFSQSLRLISRAAKLLKGIKDQVDGIEDLILPHRLLMNIQTFEHLLFDIQVFIQKQIESGWLKRFIRRYEIQSNLDNFNDLIDQIAQEFGIRSHLSIHARLTEDNLDRKRDNSQIRSMIGDALKNDEVLLHQLQVQRLTIQSLENAFNEHMVSHFEKSDDQPGKLAFQNINENVINQRLSQGVSLSAIKPMLRKIPIVVKNGDAYDDKLVHRFIEKSLRVLRRVGYS